MQRFYSEQEVSQTQPQTDVTHWCCKRRPGFEAPCVSACTCAVRPLVGALGLGALVLPPGQSGQLGGDLLLHRGGLLHLVGGADQVDGQLRLHRLGADALLARWNLGRGFGGGGQNLELGRQRHTPGFAQHAAPERLVAPALTTRRKSTQNFRDGSFVGKFFCLIDGFMRLH